MSEFELVLTHKDNFGILAQPGSFNIFTLQFSDACEK